MRLCPKCGSKYQNWLEKCAGCGGQLIDVNLAYQPSDGLPDLKVQGIPEAGQPAYSQPEPAETGPSDKNLLPVAIKIGLLSAQAVGRILQDAGIAFSLHKKQYILSDYYEVMVARQDYSRASDILKATGESVQTEQAMKGEDITRLPGVFKTGPLPNSPEHSHPDGLPTAQFLRCPHCGSARLDFRYSLHPSAVNISCLNCRHNWQE
jgi:uncharacterized protein (DUF983 family)